MRGKDEISKSLRVGLALSLALSLTLENKTIIM